MTLILVVQGGLPLVGAFRISYFKVHYVVRYKVIIKSPSHQYHGFLVLLGRASRAGVSN
jgi:hypothetical protein